MTDPFLSTGDPWDYDPLKRDTLLQNQDPFQGSWSQTHRMRAHCEIMVNGVNITDKIKPHLISVRIVDGNPEKTCDIEIDDRDALMPIPPLVAPVHVRLGWEREEMARAFNGVIMGFEHGFGRKQGGRRMWVNARGTNSLTTRLKSNLQGGKGEGAEGGQKEGKNKVSLPDWLKTIVKWGGGAGAYVNSAFEKVKQDRWDLGSPVLHEAQALGEKHGAEVQWGEGDFLYFEVPGERGRSCRAIWRDNLIGWRVRPFRAPSAYGGSSGQSYNPQAGQVEQQDQKRNASGPGGMAVAMGLLDIGANASNVAASNEGNMGVMDSSAGGVGRIAMNGEPRAQWNSYVSLEGARTGVDGLYQIKVAEHLYSRQGYVTWLDVTPWSKAPPSENVYTTWPLPKPGPNIGN